MTYVTVACWRGHGKRSISSSQALSLEIITIDSPPMAHWQAVHQGFKDRQVVNLRSIQYIQGIIQYRCGPAQAVGQRLRPSCITYPSIIHLSVLGV